MTVTEVLAKLRSLRPKESYVYYDGDLAYDREDNPVLITIATEVWNRHIAGDLFLTQRRLPSPKLGVYRGEYIATKATKYGE